MKTLLLMLALVFLSQAVLAEPDPPKSDLEIIIQAMAEQYAKSAAQDLAIKELQAQAAKVMGEHMAAQLGNATFNVLSVVGLVQNVQSYDEAKTEGSKYSAAAHGVANAISIAFAPIPIVGLMANLVVVGQDLTAAFISKDFILEQARMRAEISRIYRETSELQTKQYDSELQAMKAITERLKAINLLSEQAVTQHADHCLKDEFDFKTPDACMMSSLTLERLIIKQLHTIGMILNFKGRFLNIHSLSVNFKTMQELYNDAEIQLKQVSALVRLALNQVVFNQVWIIKNQLKKDILFRHCEVSLILKLKQYLTGKKEVLQSPEDNVWQIADVEEKKVEIRQLIEGVCLDYIKTAPVELKDLALRIIN